MNGGGRYGSFDRNAPPPGNMAAGGLGGAAPKASWQPIASLGGGMSKAPPNGREAWNNNGAAANGNAQQRRPATAQAQRPQSAATSAAPPRSANYSKILGESGASNGAAAQAMAAAATHEPPGGTPQRHWPTFFAENTGPVQPKEFADATAAFAPLAGTSVPGGANGRPMRPNTAPRARA